MFKKYFQSRMRRKSQLEREPIPPVTFHPHSNGEYIPNDPGPKEFAAEKAYHELVDNRSRKLGISRRSFMESICGLAGGLYVMNSIYGCSGAENPYNVTEEDTFDPAAAKNAIGGKAGEFVFDGQTHQYEGPGETENFIQGLFLESDTEVVSISEGPELLTDLLTCERAATRDAINLLAESQRAVIQFKVFPEMGQSQLDAMDQALPTFRPKAWKTYPQAGSWEYTDTDVGIPFIEHGRELDIKIFMSHKGLGIGGRKGEDPTDMGVVAAMYPDTTFIAFHSGVRNSVELEGPYNENNPEGADRLIKTYLDNNIGGGTKNLYGDWGSVWNFHRNDPIAAGHFVGKMLLYMGEDQICWGTDSQYTGSSPQEQIAAFRAFQIPQSLQDEFGYPAITQQAREKILGLNNAKIYGLDPANLKPKFSLDDLNALKVAMVNGEIPRLHRRPLGPGTRREFFQMLAAGKLDHTPGYLA